MRCNSIVCFFYTHFLICIIMIVYLLFQLSISVPAIKVSLIILWMYVFVNGPNLGLNFPFSWISGHLANGLSSFHDIYR